MAEIKTNEVSDHDDQSLDFNFIFRSSLFITGFILHFPFYAGRSTDGGDRLVESDAVATIARATQERIGTFFQLDGSTENRHR